MPGGQSGNLNVTSVPGTSWCKTIGMAPLYDPDILPTLREMRATWTGPTITLWSSVNFKGSMELGYAFASLFWPELIEFQGGIFVAEQFGRTRSTSGCSPLPAV